MVTLGIESTAHTLGIGLYLQGKILANVFDTFKRPYGGMKPSEVADHHAMLFENLLKEAFEVANINADDLKLVAYSKGPGLAPALRIARAGALLIANIKNISIIPVHHSVAHIEIAKYYTRMKDPLIVYVSGGNTQILVKEGAKYKVLGETFDVGLGNAIDMLARNLGLKEAHGGTIERLAKKGNYIENMPYTVKGMDFAFSGLVTKAKQLMDFYNKEDIAFSFQENAFAMVVEAAERALMLTNKEEIVFCGGVAQNERFQEMLRRMAEENKVKFGFAPNEFNRDNGAMIAYTGKYLYDKYGQNYPDKEYDIKPRYRIEDVWV